MEWCGVPQIMHIVVITLAHAEAGLIAAVPVLPGSPEPSR